MATQTLTMPEVAAVLRRHPKTIYRWVREGRMPVPVIMVNGHPLVYRPQLEAYLAGGDRVAS